MSFAGFSEEDLHRMKFVESGTKSGSHIGNPNVRKIDKLGLKPKRTIQQYKTPTLQSQNSDDIIDDIQFDKCKLSLKSPTSTLGAEDTVDLENMKNSNGAADTIKTETQEIVTNEVNSDVNSDVPVLNANINEIDDTNTERRNSDTVTPDVVRSLDNYTENEGVAHKVKLEELQLKQKLMEEQNKKRKEMLAKALADRTKQTEEEVQKLEKIKKELQILDGQFSLDVAVLRKKIDQACLSYSEAEKHYLRVEKDFLQAKINLQKEKEKKELLTEHLCALITHNETRKAQKLETLMLELATDKNNIVNLANAVTPTEDQSIIIDGVDVTTVKREKETELEPECEPETDTEPEWEPETDTESETEPQPETDMEPEWEPETNMKPESESERRQRWRWSRIRSWSTSRSRSC